MPSAANVADLPSRGAYGELAATLPGSLPIHFNLPSFDTFIGPLDELMQALYSLIV